jgi:hypothetical protein
MRRRRLLWVLVSAALVASPLAGAGCLAARASGITLSDPVELGVQLLALSAAFLAGAFVIGRVLPASWSQRGQEAIAWLAAVGWMVFQWLLSGLFATLG